MKYVIVKIKTSRLNSKIDRTQERPEASRVKLRNSIRSNEQRDSTYEIKVKGLGGPTKKLQIPIMRFPERQNRVSERKK